MAAGSAECRLLLGCGDMVSSQNGWHGYDVIINDIIPGHGNEVLDGDVRPLLLDVDVRENEKGKGIMTVAPCVTLDRLNSRIAAIEEYFDSSKARRLLPLVKKTGWHKGEIKDLTPLQFRRVLGYAPRKSVIVKGKVPWEYCFDQLAAEFGYSSDEDLKRELEHIARKKKELDKLKAEASGLNRDVKLRSREKTAVRFKNIKVSHNGLIGGKEILVGGKRVGVLVQNPSTWSVHITDDHKISKRALESPLAETRFLSQAEKEARKIFEITGPTLRKRKRKTKKRKKGGS